MDIKDYLKQVRKIDKEIASNIDLIERLRAKEHSCTSVLSDEPRNDTVSDKTKITDKRIMIEESISKTVISLYERIATVKSYINLLPSSIHRTAFTEYYINNKSWEEVAVMISYSYPQTQRIHSEGLIFLRKNIHDTK